MLTVYYFSRKTCTIFLWLFSARRVNVTGRRDSVFCTLAHLQLFFSIFFRAKIAKVSILPEITLKVYLKFQLNTYFLNWSAIKSVFSLLCYDVISLNR